MSPPTEQLIRDYLNRLSVAARGRLSAEDRRALVTRTHDFIDRNASPSGPPTAMEVASLLARLGDPAGLVDEEVGRLTALRGETPAGPAGRREKASGRLRRLSGYSSWHWPSAPGSENVRSRLLNGDSDEYGPAGDSAEPGADSDRQAAEAAGPASAVPPPIWVPLQPGPADGLVSPDGAQPDAPGESAAAGDRPGWPSAAGLSIGDHERPAGPQGGSQDSPAGPQGRRQDSPAGPQGGSQDSPAGPQGGSHADTARSTTTSNGTAPPGTDGPGYGPGTAATEQEYGPSRVSALRASASAGRSRLLAWARRNPVEAVAITLMGLGGAAYPPIWLLGVPFALASRAWDYRDRWIGLAVPVLVLVVGTAFGIMLGDRYATFGGYVHEAWVYADIFSRVGAVAGAGYLIWRLRHAWRVPTVPPWNKPHRVD
jgi:hypothetical protein